MNFAVSKPGAPLPQGGRALRWRGRFIGFRKTMLEGSICARMPQGHDIGPEQ